MVGLKKLLFDKNLKELSLFTLEQNWPWRELPADPNASWKDEKQEI